MLVGRELGVQRQRIGLIHLHAGAAPQRDEHEKAVGRYGARVRLGGQRHRPNHLTAGEIDGRERHRKDARRIQRASVAAHREAARERVAVLRRQRERPRARERAVGRERKLLHVVLRCACRVDLRAVRAECEAVPRRVDRQCALDLPARDVDDGQRRFHQAVRGDERVATIRRDDDVERQRAERKMLPGGREPPPVRQQHRAVAHGARSGRRLRRRGLGAGDQDRRNQDKAQRTKTRGDLSDRRGRCDGM